MKRRAGIEDWHAPAQACRAVQGDRAYMGFIEMLVGFKCISLMVELDSPAPDAEAAKQRRRYQPPGHAPGRSCQWVAVLEWGNP